MKSFISIHGCVVQQIIEDEYQSSGFRSSGFLNAHQSSSKILYEGLSKMLIRALPKVFIKKLCLLKSYELLFELVLGFLKKFSLAYSLKKLAICHHN